jgi:tRNA dimethylallyltransferase
MLGLEYREIGAHLCGDTSYEEMVANLKTKIGQFAKRQMTYFRGMERRGIPITWIQPDDVDEILEAVSIVPSDR